MMNFLKIKNWNPFRSSFMYIDAPEYVADDIFADHELFSIKFRENELWHPELNYIIVECTISRRDEEKFIECMEHLRRKLAFMEYNMENYDLLSRLFTCIQDNYEELKNEYC